MLIVTFAVPGALLSVIPPRVPRASLLVGCSNVAQKSRFVSTTVVTYIRVAYCVHMAVRRTTIELDEDLVARARAALGAPTTRATVEEALRRVAASAGREQEERASRQRSYLELLDSRVDASVLGSDEMWR